MGEESRKNTFVRTTSHVSNFHCIFQMSRARTPLGAVPISTIYGFDYPLTNGVSRDISDRHESSVQTTEVQTTGRVQPLWKKGKLTDAVAHMIRSTSAYSENR